MSKSHWAQISAFLNLLGSVFLFLSFQATSTSLLLVSGADKSTSFCVGDTAMFKFSESGTGVEMGTKCPIAANSKPTAVVNTDLPELAKWGWIVLVIGFLVQIFSIEPSPLSHEDLKTLRKARKIMGHSN